MSSEDLRRFSGRRFSFYPPILNIEHNEWTYRRATWSEILVHNTKKDTELWIPRQYLGEVSRIDEPVMIIGLSQELEYQGGAVWPHKRRVTEMPRVARAASASPPLPPSGASGENPAERRVGRLILLSLAAAVTATLTFVVLVRTRESGEQVRYEAVVQAELGLTAEDTYFSVVRKLGQPAADRWRSETGERQYRALDYPRLGLTVILMGADRDQVFYIGAKDRNWKNTHSVKLPGGRNTDSILRNLGRF